MFDLPAATPYRLRNAPLVQAVAQARYPLQARLATLDGLAFVQERVADRYPYLESVGAEAGFEFQLGPNGAQAAFGNAQQYIFKSDDSHALWVAPDSVTVTVDGSDYRGADDFKARFREIVEVLGAALRIPRCDRVAARYLTLAEDQSPGSDAWSDWFKPEFTGWASGHVPSSHARLQSTVNQVHLVSKPQGDLSEFPAEITAMIRHGLVPAGSTVLGFPPVQVSARSFVIDLDVYCEAAQPWDTVAIASQFDSLHSQIDRFFYWTLDLEGRNAFGYEEVK